MGLFQRKTQTGTEKPLYTLGLNRNLLIVGLGNPGAQHQDTRHNIGFNCIDSLAKKLEFPEWVHKKDLKCMLTKQNVADTNVILMKPQTYMNLSGEAVQAVKNFYKVANNQIIAVYDELDIPFGQIRTRLGGSSAGHGGVESLIKHIGENFGRIRVGTHNDLADKAEGKDFVLSKFNKEEQEKLAALLREVNSILSEYIYGQPVTAETRSFLV